MIDVQHLTKNYPGGVTAVQDVSFSVAPGEIMGFLGPNGAGKSTTMRILSGYLSPSGGQVRVKGMDVTRQNMEVRQCLGYLPETCPLYTEMRVEEYLRYRADLKGVSHRHRRSAVERAMEQCGLLDVQKRLIGQLSKGYRQRVGIADALVHNPDLLILDEPTIGLDPNQIVQIRKLIRDLASSHTLLISSHILSEIEATCNRVVVMNHGQILESATLEELAKRWSPGMGLTLEVKAEAEEVDRVMRVLPDLIKLHVLQEGEWARAEMEFSIDQHSREKVYACVREQDWDLRELYARRHNLEETFVSMTGGGEKA